MRRLHPRLTRVRSWAASDGYKRQVLVTAVLVPGVGGEPLLHLLFGLRTQLEAEMPKDGIDHGHRLTLEVGETDIEKPFGPAPPELLGTLGGPGPELELARAHFACVHLAPMEEAARRPDHAAQGGYACGRVAMRLDDAGIGEYRQQGIEVGDMARVLQQPALIR